jgi:putative DNA primase/helicase
VSRAHGGSDRLETAAEIWMGRDGLDPEREWPYLHRLRSDGERLHLSVASVWAEYLRARASGLSSDAGVASALARGRSTTAAPDDFAAGPAVAISLPPSTTTDLDTLAGELSPSDDGSEEDEDAQPPSGKRSRFPEYSDGANAEMFVRDHGQDLLFVAELRSWFAWKGTRWLRDIDGEVERRAWKTVSAMIRRAGRRLAKANGEEEQKAAVAQLRQAERCADLRAVQRMIATARFHEKVIMPLAVLDSDGYLFNCANGTLDLRSGVLRSHTRADFITKISPIVYDASAAAPRFEAFIGRIFASDQGLIDFVQRLLGYAMVGQPVEHIMPVAFGSGANGKTTLIEAIRHVFGDYAQQAPGDLLLRRVSTGGPTPDLARLPGARLVLVSETEEGKHWNESLVKQLTGGDRIAARDLYTTLFEFTPVATYLLMTNHLPKVSTTGEAIWRRLRIIPFDVTIPETERDPHLLQALRAEAAGILRWLVAGALKWADCSLGDVPGAVTKSTAKYRRAADVVGRFLDDCCELGDSLAIGATELHAAFTAWADANGDESLTLSKFGRELNDRGFSACKSGTVTRQGLRLRPDSRTLADLESNKSLRNGV